MKIVMSQFLSPMITPIQLGYMASNLESNIKTSEAQVTIVNLETSMYSEMAAVKELLSFDPDMLVFASFASDFPCFLWNTSRILHICDLIAEDRPDIPVVLCGPEIQHNYEQVLTKHPNVIILDVSEKEMEFQHAVKAYMLGKSLKAIPGAAWKKGDKIYKNPPPTPLQNLDQIPSPYLSGIFNPEQMSVLFVENARGCPFNCIYCLFRQNYDGVRFFSVKRTCDELGFGHEHGLQFGFVLDATFNASPLHMKKLCESIIKQKLGMEFVIRARIDRLNSRTTQLLVRAGVTCMDVGLESTNPQTLNLINRPMNLKRFEQGIELAKKAGIEIDLNVIIGLPGDTVETIRKTLDFAIKLDVDTIEPYLLQVLPGTDMARDAEKHKLRYMIKPPYLIQETPTITQKQLYSLYIETLKTLREYRYLTPDLNKKMLMDVCFS